MKIRAIVFFLVLLLSGITCELRAQYYFYDDTYYDKVIAFEVGASFGGMNCFTDLGGRKGIGKKIH